MEQQQWNDLVELDSCDGDVMVGESLGREPPNGQQQQQIRPRPRITREPIIGRGRHLISTNGRGRNASFNPRSSYGHRNPTISHRGASSNPNNNRSSKSRSTGRKRSFDQREGGTNGIHNNNNNGQRRRPVRPPSYHDELEPYFPHQRFPSPPAADIRNNFGHQFDQQFVGHSQQMARNNGMYTYGPGLLQSQDQNEMGPNNYRRTMPSIHKMDYGIGDRAILDRISLARPTEKSGDCYTFQPVDGRCRETENLNIPPERIPAYIAAGGRTEPIGAVNGQYFGDNGEYYDDDYGPQQHPKQMKMNSFWPNPHPFPAPNHSWRHGKPFDDRFGGRRSPHEVNNNQQQQFQYTDYDDPQNFLAARRSNLPFEASITNRNDSSESSETYEQMMNRLSPTFQSSSIVRGSRLPLLAEPPVVDDAETALKKHQQEALNAYASAYRSPSPPGGGFNVVNQGQGKRRQKSGKLHEKSQENFMNGQKFRVTTDKRSSKRTVMNIDGHDTPSSSAASFHRPEPKQRPEMTEKAEAFVQIQRNPECSQVPQQKSTNYPQNQAQSQSKLPTPEAASTLPSFLKTVSKPPVFYASATCGLMSIVEMDVCTTPNASASDHEENMMMLNAADPIEPGQIVANASNQQQQTVEQTAGLLPTDFQPQTNNKSVKGILVAHRKNSLIPPAMLQLVDFGDYFTVKAAIVSSSCIKKKEGLSSAADAPPDGTEQPSGVTPTNPQQKKLSANEKNPVQQQSNGVPKSAANNTAADVHIQLRPNNDDQDQPPSHQPVVMAAENLTNRHDQLPAAPSNGHPAVGFNLASSLSAFVLGQCVTSEVSKICANEVIGSKEKFLVKQAKQIKSQDGQLFNFYNSYQAKKHLLNEREEELTRMKMTSEERIHELEVDAELKNARILKLEGDLKNGDEVKESQAATIKKLQLDVILKEQHMVELEEEIASLKEKETGRKKVEEELESTKISQQIAMLNYQVVSEQLSDLKKKQDSILKKKPANTDSDLKKKESDLKKKQAAIESELKKKQAAMESELKELRAECAKVGNDSTEYKSKYENARNTLERAKKVLALLRTENEKLFHENEAQRALREKADRENNELREEVREIREMLTASKESIMNVISRLQPLEPLVSAVQPDDQLRQSTSSTETPAAETKKLDEKVVKKRELSVTDENCNR